MATDKALGNQNPGSSGVYKCTIPKLPRRTQECKKADMRTLNGHLGWVEQMTIQERTKKLTTATSEGLVEWCLAIRNLFTELSMENSKLRGISQFSASELKGLFDDFTKIITEKTVKKLRSKEVKKL